MPTDRIEYAFAILAVFCVLTIFLFPAMQGPYSVVNGPVTALLSLRAAACLRLRIVRAGLSRVRSRVKRAGLAMCQVVGTAILAAGFQDGLPSGCTSILRC